MFSNRLLSVKIIRIAVIYSFGLLQLLVIRFWSLHLLFKSLLSGESGLLQSNLAEFSEPCQIWPRATKIINFEY